MRGRFIVMLIHTDQRPARCEPLLATDCYHHAAAKWREYAFSNCDYIDRNVVIIDLDREQN